MRCTWMLLGASSTLSWPGQSIGFLSELHSLGIELFLHQQGIDTTTPAGKAMFQMMGVFAEFERSMIRERVNAGLTGKPCSISPKFGWSVLGLASSSPVPSATECRW